MSFHLTMFLVRLGGVTALFSAYIRSASYRHPLGPTSIRRRRKPDRTGLAATCAVGEMSVREIVESTANHQSDEALLESLGSLRLYGYTHIIEYTIAHYTMVCHATLIFVRVARAWYLISSKTTMCMTLCFMSRLLVTLTIRADQC